MLQAGAFAANWFEMPVFIKKQAPSVDGAANVAK
jgi:hypothetical protein